MKAYKQWKKRLYGIQEDMLPEYWGWNDICNDLRPALLVPKRFHCASAGREVVCHAPTMCNEGCLAYNAKAIG